MMKIADTESQYPNVNHFVIVTGDKDYSPFVNGLLLKGKYVHIISWKDSLASETKTSTSYLHLAKKYPKYFNLIMLEDILSNTSL